MTHGKAENFCNDSWCQNSNLIQYQEIYINILYQSIHFRLGGWKNNIKTLITHYGTSITPSILLPPHVAIAIAFFMLNRQNISNSFLAFHRLPIAQAVVPELCPHDSWQSQVHNGPILSAFRIQSDHSLSNFSIIALCGSSSHDNLRETGVISL